MAIANARRQRFLRQAQSDRGDRLWDHKTGAGIPAI